MALSSAIALFKLNQNVWVPHKADMGWEPRRGYVEKVTRGQIHIRYYPDIRTSFSPNNRMLCLTNKECSKICDLLNDRR